MDKNVYEKIKKASDYRYTMRWTLQPKKHRSDP